MLCRASLDVDGVAQMQHVIGTGASGCNEQTENFKRRFLAVLCCAVCAHKACQSVVPI